MVTEEVLIQSLTGANRRYKMDVRKTTNNIIKVVIGLMVLSAVAFVGSCTYLIGEVNEAGGVKQVIINTGKEVKDIAKQIEED